MTGCTRLTMHTHKPTGGRSAEQLDCSVSARGGTVIRGFDSVACGLRGDTKTVSTRSEQL